MKARLCIPIVLIFISFQSFSQSPSTEIKPIKKWKLTQVAGGLGVDWARYQNMSLPGILAFAKNPYELQRDLHNMTEESTTFTAGVALFGNVSYTPYSFSKHEYATNQEIRLGIGIYSPKEAMLSYKNKDLDTSIVYCNIHGEFAVEGAYLFNGQWGKKFNWFAGAGTSASLSFANEMVIISGDYFEEGEHPSLQENKSEVRFKAKPVYYVRAYIPYGLYYRVNATISLGVEGRIGTGVQMITEEKSNYMRKSGSLILGIKAQL